MADNEELVHKQQARVAEAVTFDEGETPEHVLPLAYAGERIWGRRLQILIGVVALVVVLALAFLVHLLVAIVAAVVALAAMWWLAHDSYPAGVVVTPKRVVVVQLGLQKRAAAEFPRGEVRWAHTRRGFELSGGATTTRFEPTTMFAVQFEAFATALAGPVTGDADRRDDRKPRID